MRWLTPPRQAAPQEIASPLLSRHGRQDNMFQAASDQRAATRSNARRPDTDEHMNATSSTAAARVAARRVFNISLCLHYETITQPRSCITEDEPDSAIRLKVASIERPTANWRPQNRNTR